MIDGPIMSMAEGKRGSYGGGTDKTETVRICCPGEASCSPATLTDQSCRSQMRGKPDPGVVDSELRGPGAPVQDNDWCTRDRAQQGPVTANEIRSDPVSDFLRRYLHLRPRTGLEIIPASGLLPTYVLAVPSRRSRACE